MAIVDCGIGNLFSIQCALRKVGLSAETVSQREKEKLKNVDAILLPGVGNFKAGSRNLQILKPEIIRLVENGVLLLGICLGMQLLFEKSEESAGKGLNIFKGNVLKLPSQVKIPHMGWNTLRISKQNSLVEGVGDKDYFYFVHSYYADPTDKNVVVAATDYGINFASVVADSNLYGTQFHPEKSGKSGEKILKNFVSLVKK